LECENGAGTIERVGVRKWSGDDRVGVRKWSGDDRESWSAKMERGR
jgi:hypothetical protein